MFLNLFSTLSFSEPLKTHHTNDDHASYEAITGESADEDRMVWDEFYKNTDFIYGKDAIAFLKENIHLIPPKGKAFVPAMGEGRNALFLAKKGFDVDGNDISDVAVDRAATQAKAQNLTLHTQVVDLMQFKYPENHYDLVVLSFFYDKKLIPQLKKSLKKGGYILVNCKIDSKDNKKNPIPNEFPVKAETLKEDLKDFQIIIYKEFMDHGTPLVGVLAKKT